jgi:uncharacterized protein (TIGR02246 family)
MKTNILQLGCFICIALLTAMKANSQSDAELKAKIEKINKEMASAMIEGNMQKSLSYYADDAISMPNNGKMLEGKDAIRKSNEEMMKSGSKVKSFEATTLKVKSCENMVTEIGNFKISFLMAGKPEPMEDHGKYVTIWEKQKDGSLKVKVEIWNTDVNNMKMNQ